MVTMVSAVAAVTVMAAVTVLTAVAVVAAMAVVTAVMAAVASDRAKLPRLVLPAGGVPSPHRGAGFGGLAGHVQRLCERFVHPGPGPSVLGGEQPTGVLVRGGFPQ